MTGKPGVFICPSCQAVVKSEKPLEEGVICGECSHEFGKPTKASVGKVGQMPRGRSEGAKASVIRDFRAKKAPPVRAVGVIEAQPVTAKSLDTVKAESEKPNSDDEMIMPDGTRRVRRRKKREKKEKKKGLVIFLTGWLCVVISVLALFKTGKLGNGTETGDPAGTGPESLTGTEKAILLESRGPIESHFFSFLRTGTPAERTQFIDNPVDLSLPLRKFYDFNTFNAPESRVKRIGENILNLSDSAVAIETIWADEKMRRLGTVHIFDKKEGWKLDWEAYAPYSSESWSKFRSRLGSQEGEFRLLVRRRRTSNQDKKVSLSFYRQPKLTETANEFRKTESPEVDLDIESDLAKEFLGLWTSYQDGDEPHFGSILGRALDPEGYLRITVRLAWEKDEQDKDILVLKDIIGTGWFGKTIQKYYENDLKAADDEAKEKFTEASSSK